MAAVVRAAPTPTKAPAPVAAPAPARVAPVAPAGPRLNLGGGAPIPTPTRMRLESSLGANLSGVRVHSGPGAATAAGNLNARAFAFGPQIVLGSGQRADDLPLMGHEAAHVIQQQAAPTPQRWADGVTLPPAHARGFAGPAVVLGRAAGERATLQRWTPSTSDRFEGEANRAAAAVVRGEPFTVTERTAGPRVQRFGLGDVLDYFADKANNIPGFRMFTIVLGVNPINMSGVDRSAANILRAVIEFIPGGSLITQALDNHGIIDKVANWVSEQIKSLGMIGGAIKDAVLEFLDSLGWRDIFHLGDVWDRAKRIFTVPIDRIIDFAKNLITGIITFIKDAILIPLAKLAERTPAWDLLIAVLGRNPITDEPVPRTAETLIAGFLKLIGQEEVWENMKRAGALGRAWAWFQGTLGGLIALVSSLPGRAIAAFQSLELMDIVLLPRAFIKIGAVFGGFVRDFIGWAGTAVWNLLEIVFDVVSPKAFGYIKRTGAALKSILKNPLPFVGNLVKAALLGFNNFTNKFGKYLQAGLIDWLTGSLPGIYIPKAFSLPEIVKFALSVLGLSWANVREKLVKATSETAVKAMEVGFDIVKTLVKDGPAAAWDQIKTQLGNLQKLVIDGITDLVVDAVVTKGIPKLLAMLIPGAGFIPAILSIYDIVMVFVKKLAQIAAVVKSFVDSIVAIAAGNIAGAAARVEAALAGLLTLAINFLAGFAGLGKIADKLKGVFDKVRAPIDKALDWLVNWIVTGAKKLFAKAFGGKAGGPDERTPEQKRAALDAAVREAKTLDPNLRRRGLRSALNRIKGQHRLTDLSAVAENNKLKVHAAINPEYSFELADVEGLDEAVLATLKLARSRIENLSKPANVQDAERELVSVMTKGIPGVKLEFQLDSETKGRVVTVVIPSQRPRYIGLLVPPGFSRFQTLEVGENNWVRHRASGKAGVFSNKGTLIQRYVWRNINSTEAALLAPPAGARAGAQMRDRDLPPRGGTGAQLKTPLQHVSNEKRPSDFSSATTAEGGKIAQRDTGRVFNEHGVIKIDLLWIKKENIIDLSTREAAAHWGLTQPGEAVERALKDVLFTKEVLIKGGIPRNAIVDPK